MFFSSNPLAATLSPLGRGEGVVSIRCAFRYALCLMIWKNYFDPAWAQVLRWAYAGKSGQGVYNGKHAIDSPGATAEILHGSGGAKAVPVFAHAAGAGGVCPHYLGRHPAE